MLNKKAVPIMRGQIIKAFGAWFNPTYKYPSHAKPVVIEDDVFVGTHCIICKGVRIGNRSIVAAGSVVVKDIPNGEVWGGNPAKFIRKIANKYE